MSDVWNALRAPAAEPGGASTGRPQHPPHEAVGPTSARRRRRTGGPWLYRRHPITLPERRHGDRSAGGPSARRRSVRATNGTTWSCGSNGVSTGLLAARAVSSSRTPMVASTSRGEVPGRHAGGSELAGRSVAPSTPMRSIPCRRAPWTSWSRSPTMTTCGPGSTSSSCSACAITSALVPAGLVGRPGDHREAVVQPKWSITRTAVASGFAVASDSTRPAATRSSSIASTPSYAVVS